MPISVIDEFEIYLRTECGLSPNTIFAYLNDVKEFLDYVGKETFTAQLVEDFINYLGSERRLEGQLKDISIRRHYMAIRCFCHYFISLNRLDPKILGMLNSVRVERKTHDVLEPQDVDALISIIKSRTPLSRTTNIRRDVAIVLILYSSGLRVSELCGLNMGDISLAEKEIRVKGKGNCDRVVPTTSKCIEAIKSYLCLDRLAQLNPESNTNAIFIKSNGKRITRRAITDMLTSLSCRAGIKHTNAHMLRRSCATLLMRRGMDLELVQALLGHQNLSTTQAYLTVGHDWLMKIHRECHPFGEKNED
jgi:site-specific recombinase XerD